MRTIALWYGISLFIFSCVVSANDSDTAAVEAAKQHFKRGMEYFDARDYEKAVDEFRTAYDIKPTWKLRYNIGQAEAAAKRYGLALEEFEAYLGKGGDEVLIEREKDVLREIDRLRMLVGVLDVRAPDGTEIFIDDVLRGTMPLPGVLRVAVGDHQVWMRHNGRTLFDGNVKIAGAIRTRLNVSDTKDGTPEISTFAEDGSELAGPPENDTTDSAESTAPGKPNNASDRMNDTPPPKKQRFAFIRNMSRNQKLFFFSGIASSAVGLGALGGGVGFTIAAANAADERDKFAKLYSNTTDADLEEEYKNNAQDQQKEVDRNTKLMLAGYVAGGVFIAAGATLLIFYFKNEKKSKVTVIPTLNGVGVTF